MGLHFTLPVLVVFNARNFSQGDSCFLDIDAGGFENEGDDNLLPSLRVGPLVVIFLIQVPAFVVKGQVQVVEENFLNLIF